MSEPTTSSGRQLWQLLPEVYRNRDRADVPQVAGPAGGEYGHLAAYLDAFGALLDLIRQTLDQRLADSFPDEPDYGLAAQSWLLPYFAELLDARLLSPHVSGRRAEVAEAVAWRQRKGTGRALEAIAEAVGDMEVEVREGWQHVAVTPRLDMPLLPALALGADRPIDPGNPLEAAGHPGLPAVTPDLRYGSRAVAASAHHPAARTTAYPRRPQPGDDDSAPISESVPWRQANPHGTPCFPGSYEDASRRTVDVRTPTWARGTPHPGRLVLYTPPPQGFFPLHAVRLTWAQRTQEQHADHVSDETENGTRLITNPSQRTGFTGTPRAVVITSNPPPFTEEVVRIEDLAFLGTITVSTGRLELHRVAAKRVVVNSTAADALLDAVDCLFDEVEVANGTARFDACTVRGTITATEVLASDSILTGTVAHPVTGDPPEGCYRYSRVPSALAKDLPKDQRFLATSDDPVFHEVAFCEADGTTSGAPLVWGDPAYSVLHPATRPSISFGAEDGGEMGAFHHRHYRAQDAAVLAKLADFLPVGIEPVLRHDARLLTRPPSD